MCTWTLWEKDVGLHPELLIWRLTSERFDSNDSTEQTIEFLTKVIRVLVPEGTERETEEAEGGRAGRKQRRTKTGRTGAVSALLPSTKPGTWSWVGVGGCAHHMCTQVWWGGGQRNHDLCDYRERSPVRMAGHLQPPSNSYTSCLQSQHTPRLASHTHLVHPCLSASEICSLPYRHSKDERPGSLVLHSLFGFPVCSHVRDC